MTFTKTKYTTQYMDNWSFDDTYKQNAVELVAEDSGSGVLRKLQVDADGKLKTTASVTVGDVTISNADGAIQDGVDGLIKATVLDKTNSNPLAVAVVNNDGTQITSFTTDVSSLSTSANQTNGTQKTQIVDSGGEAVTVTDGKLDVNASIDTTGLATTTTDTNTGTIAGDTTSIDSKIPALGQALAAASVPVVLPAAQITTLTPPAAITGFATSAKQDTIIGHVDGIETSLSSIDGKITAVNTGAVVVSSSALPTGAATAAKQDDIITAIEAIPGGGGVQYTEGDTDSTITGTAALVEGAANALNVMTQPLTDTQLRASDVKVTLDGESVPVTGTFYQATQPVSGTVTANLSATDNAVLDSIESDTTTIAGAISGTEMQVDIVSAPTLTVNSHAVTNAGTFAVQVDGSALTSLQLIDDAVYTDGSGTVTKGVAVLGQDGTNPQAIKTDTNGELQVDVLTMPTTTVTATDLDIRPLVNTDVVTAELSAVDNAVLDTIAAKDFATQTTLAAMNAKMVSGTDIGDVTINNSTGAAAVNIQDGGNTITVDYATTGSGTATGALRVELPTNGTGVVGLNAGTALIGKVSIDQVTANANEVVTKTGSVTAATLSAETTKVIGVTRTADGSGNLLTSTTNALDVNLKSGFNTGSGTATGAIRVELPTNGTGTVGLNTGSNAIGKLAANSGVDIGDVDVTSVAAGTNLIGDVGIQPRTTLGFDTFMASGSDGSSILVATAQSVKGSAGKVYGYYIYNPETAVTFVHFYNTASASVTVGTTNPLFTLAIPAGSAANLMNDIGITFGTAITVAATTTAGGNTAPATGVSAVIWYK